MIELIRNAFFIDFLTKKYFVQFHIFYYLSILAHYG